MLGIGDVYIDGIIEGQLGRIRLRGIPDIDNHAKKIRYMVKNNT